MADVKLEKKSFGIQARTKAKNLPWAYLAFAAVFLGLNIAGLTTGLGAGILGNLPQGAILNGNVWQSIANGAYLLGQGTIVGAGVLSPAIAYAGIREAVKFGRFKNAQKFSYQKGLVRGGVDYDRELQKTEALVNSMLPSSNFAASYLEKALAYRQKYKDTKNPFKKAIYQEKYTWAEDIVRRSIVKLTDRLAELSKLQNRQWKRYNSVTGLQQMTVKEIASRKREMQMIQEYLWSILNKVDDTDPFVTTLIAQVKKHRIDKLNKTTTMAGIYLVPETADPTFISQFNDALVQKKNVRNLITTLYNDSSNEIVSSNVYVSEEIARKIAHLGLADIDASRQQARASADEILNLQTQAQIIVDDMRLNLDQSNKSLDNIKDVENNANIILATLRNTLRNARNKKQGINKAYNQSVKLLTDIGVAKADAESACQRILDLETDAKDSAKEAASAATGAEKSRRKAQSNADKSENFAKKAKDSADEAYSHAGSAMDDADRAYRSRVAAENFKRKAQSNADKTSNILVAAQSIATQLQDALTSANDSKAEMQRAVTQAQDALTKMGVKDRVANAFLASIVENWKTSKIKAAEASIAADEAIIDARKTNTAADEAITGARIVEGMTNTARNRNAEIKELRDEAKSNATKSKKDANATKRNRELSDEELEKMRKKGLTAADYAEATGKIKDIAEEELVKTKTARLGAEDEQTKAEESAKNAHSYEQSVEQIWVRSRGKENTIGQILDNIDKLYRELKTTKKVETKELEKAKTDLTSVILQLNIQIENAQSSVDSSSNKFVESLQSKLDECEKLKKKFETYEEQMEKAAKSATENAEKIQKIADEMQKHYNNARGKYDSIEARLDHIEDKFFDGEIVSAELTALSKEITTLKTAIEALKTGKVSQYQLEKLKKQIAATDTLLFNRLTGNDTAIDDLTEQLNNLIKKIDEIKTIKPNTKKFELNKVLWEIKGWARLIYYAKKKGLKRIEWSSLGGATKFIYDSPEMQCAKRALSAISYSASKPIGATFNEFVGLTYSDLSKISSLEEANALLDETKGAISEYNSEHKV